MPVAVQSVEYLDNYCLHLTFNSGESGVADLAELVRSTPKAAPLRDPEEFRRVFLDEWPTLSCPCGFDLAPEYAYWLATGKKPSWQMDSMAKSA